MFKVSDKNISSVSVVNSEQANDSWICFANNVEDTTPYTCRHNFSESESTLITNIVCTRCWLQLNVIKTNHGAFHFSEIHIEQENDGLLDNIEQFWAIILRECSQ